MNNREKEIIAKECLKIGYKAGALDGRLKGSRKRLFEFMQQAQDKKMPLNEINEYLENYISGAEEKLQARKLYQLDARIAKVELPSRCARCIAQDFCYETKDFKIDSYELKGHDNTYLAPSL